MVGRAKSVARAVPVPRELLVRPVALHRRREVAVTGAPASRVDVAQHDLADAVVVRRQPVGVAPARPPEERGHAQRPRLALQARRIGVDHPREQLARDRLPRDHDRLEHVSRRLRQRGDPQAEDVVEAHVPAAHVGGVGGGRQVARQLRHEEGAARGLDRHPLHQRRVLAAEEVGGEPRGLFAPEGPDLDRLDREADARIEGLEHGGLLGRGVRAAGGEDEHQLRRVRGPQHVGEESHRIAVDPLQIVEEHHDRTAIAQPLEQLAEGRERPRAGLLRVRRVEPLRRLGHRRHAPEHGKQLRQVTGVARQERPHLGAR